MAPRYAPIDRRGQVAPGMLGRGTISTETYLRGDGTWATVSATGGTPGPQGDTGPQGPQGDPGAQGPAGSSGSSIWGTITGTLSDQTDLQSALDGKSSTSHHHFSTYASLSHAHAQADVTNLVSDLSGKSDTSHQHYLLYASTSHGHVITDTTNLQTALDAKSYATHQHYAAYASLSHAHIIGDTTGLQTELDGKSSTAHHHYAIYSSLSHAHAQSDVTSLVSDLAGKSSTAHHHFGTYASLSHAHAASDITSGTLTTDRLGSGTANSSTYLRGDSTWGTPGGGSNPFTMAFSTLNTGTDSNSVFATVNYVRLSVTASKRYIIEGFLIYRTAAITTGLNLAWNVPSGTALIGQSVITNALTTASVLSNNAVASSSGASTAPVWLNANNPAYVWMLASLSTTGGTITPLFRSEVSASFATLQAYSMWRMMEIA